MQASDIKCENNCKVSVIVPVYNVERYLRQCLDSLRNQTMGEGIEFICVNDGSTDSSLEILREYEKADARFCVVNKKNEGYGKTMNLGFSLASGQYIGILESDDHANPGMFELLYLAAEKYEADVVRGNYTEFTETSSREIMQYSESKYDRVLFPLDTPGLFYTNPSIWSGIYRRSFLNENKITFNETAGASFQDTSFFFEVWMYAKRAVVIKDLLLNYRKDNISSSVNDPTKVFTICDEFAFLEKLFTERNVDQRIWDIEQELKFQKYEWNLNRIAEKYKDAFYEEFRKQFIWAESHGILNKELWKADRRERLEKMLGE